MWESRTNRANRELAEEVRNSDWSYDQIRTRDQRLRRNKEDSEAGVWTLVFIIFVFFMLSILAG